MNILKEYRDVFAWSYKEMPGLNPRVVVHQLAVKNCSRPVKQAQRHFRPVLIPLIENEVNKLIEASFIEFVLTLEISIMHALKISFLFPFQS